MKKEFPIDFIIPWVDGSDPDWIEEYNKFAPEGKKKKSFEFRDYGLLRYWFRGVEKFAPWVNKVHFVTCGQKPEWLNLDCSKLHLVKHTDYIPKEYLPVFSSIPIELCLHKIPSLQDHFVYFNDDIYITDFMSPQDFFKCGLPCDCAILEVKDSGKAPQLNTIFNTINAINKNFKKKQVISKNFFKWFNPIYGKLNYFNFVLNYLQKFPGFIDFHMANCFTKKIFEDVWANCKDELDIAMQNRFRSINDINQYIFRYWQLCKGNFTPINLRRRRHFYRLDSANIDDLCKSIRDRTYKQIVINDSDIDINEKMKRIIQTFEQTLPQKSMFEI
ncbi:MAG: Stealth CR1 domain-containing protein [Treponema sp.]|nr:Stealth CR1 domain-containing protein [Treponema sp.]